MRAVVFATAGHIDHGKTSVVRALTGVDCDRLPEEKRRGITLVLGFAPLADPKGEVEISFVDVPGHERLVHTMISGAGGVDRALLVIAADEGIKPQTLEHLEVLRLLGVRGGVVALTKVDLVDAGRTAAQAVQLRVLLDGGPLGGAPIVPCSPTNGTGMAELLAAVLASARSAPRRDERYRPFRLGIDRVFSLPGAGTVATGTVRWGTVRVGDTLVALPSGQSLRVRSLEVHGQPREQADAGERVALALVGARGDGVLRGEQLLGTGPWSPSTHLAIRLSPVAGAPPLEEGQELWTHLLAGRTRARIERLHPRPLAAPTEGWALLRLERPLFAAPGDRLVFRRLSPALTVAGGSILDPRAARVPRSRAATLARLPDPIADPLATALAWIERAGPGGLEVPALAAMFALEEEGIHAVLGQALEGGQVEVVAGRPAVAVAARFRPEFNAAAARLLAEAGAAGVPLAELSSRVVPNVAARLRDYYLEGLRRSGGVREVGGRALAAGGASVDDELTARIEAVYRGAGFEAPSPAEVARRLAAKEKAVEGLVRSLIDRRRLTRLGGKWVVHRSLLDELVVALRGWGVVTFDVSAFKARFGLTRKLAIPILEWLDSERVTRREGEVRRLLPPRAEGKAAG